MKKQLISLSLCLSLLPATSFSQKWRQLTPPNATTVSNWLHGVSGTTATDVWAVGHAQTNTAPLSDYTSNNVILHWNGTGWTTYPVANPGTNINELYSVAAISPTLAWAVGDYSMGTNLQLVKWNGTSWTQQTLPNLPDETTLHSVMALSANDVWAVGTKSSTIPMLAQECLVLHYNGSSWTSLSAPPVGSFRDRFESVHGISASDVWACGTWGNNYADFHGLLMHWNGSTWTNSPVTATFDEFWDVKMVASNDVWAIGEKTSGGPFSTVHWNGSTWTEYSLADEDSNVFTATLAVKPNHEVFAIGRHIHKWSGTAWTIVDSLTRVPLANASATTVLPITGEVWAAGRWFDNSANYYKNLVLRQDTTTTTGGGTGGGATEIGTVTTHVQTIQASPNPFHRDIQVRIVTDASRPAVISVKDASGKRVLTQSRSLSTGDNIFTISTPGSMNKGMYVLEVKTSEEVTQIRLMKD
jgi:hypothetical protein